MDPIKSYFFAKSMRLLVFTAIMGKLNRDFVLFEKVYRDMEAGLDEENEKHATFRRVCYYLLRPTDGSHLPPDMIDPYICTHIIVGYAHIAKSDLTVPENLEDDTETFRQLTNLKLKNSNLKILLSITDRTQGAAFSRMASSRQGRKKFVSSALDLVDVYDFDGVDLDWEFPAWKGLPSYDKQNFVYLIKALRAGARKRKIKDLLVSAAVGTPLAIVSSSYDILELSRVVDFVNLITYDYHSFRVDRPYTGHHSPLYPRPTERDYFSTLNVAWAATYWANEGMPPKKINVGVAAFARTYNLAFAYGQGLDVPVQGPGLGNGKMNYTKVCQFLVNATKEYDVYGQVPFAYKDYDWIAYESEKSLSVKSRWVAKAGFGGVALYALNFDDWSGSCRANKKSFPLQRSISRTLELASIKSYQKYSSENAGDDLVAAGATPQRLKIIA